MSVFPGIRLLLALSFVFAVAASALAQTAYPGKPITILVPFGAGGSTDLAARAMVEALGSSLGQPLVVVNKPGASGAIAMKSLLESAPDGYTLLMATIGTNSILPAVSANPPFKYDAMTPLARTQVSATVFAVRRDAPWKSVQEVLAAAKEKPGTLRASTAGVGTLHDLGLKILLKMAGAKPDAVTAIPYKGSAQAETALVGGHVDMTFTNLIAVISHIRNGTIRALAVVPPVPGKRHPALPDTPTFAEAGLAGMDIVGWKGVIGPSGLPADVAAKWEAAVQTMTSEPVWREKIEKLGDAPGYLAGKDFGAFITKEYRRYHGVAEELGIQVGK
jgi:tripartite-type tricarboxylate transporter receptor subunit TctC